MLGVLYLVSGLVWVAQFGDCGMREATMHFDSAMQTTDPKSRLQRLQAAQEEKALPEISYMMFKTYQQLHVNVAAVSCLAEAARMCAHKQAELRNPAVCADIYNDYGLAVMKNAGEQRSELLNTLWWFERAVAAGKAAGASTAGARFNLALAHNRIGQFNATLNILQELLDEDPNDASVLLELGSVWYALQDTEQALLNWE